MFCEQCGAPIPEGAKFCEQCGAPVEQPSAPAPAPQPEPKPVPEPKPAPAPAPRPAPRPEFTAPPSRRGEGVPRTGLSPVRLIIGTLILAGLAFAAYRVLAYL